MLKELVTTHNMSECNAHLRKKRGREKRKKRVSVMPTYGWSSEPLPPLKMESHSLLSHTCSFTLVWVYWSVGAGGGGEAWAGGILVSTLRADSGFV